MKPLEFDSGLNPLSDWHTLQVVKQPVELSPALMRTGAGRDMAFTVVRR